MDIFELIADLSSEALEDPIDVAAWKLREAIETHPGRRRSVTSWRKAVGPWMGKKRLAQPIYQQVIDRGLRLGLFEIDRDSLSYPVFVPLTPKPREIEATLEPEPKPKPEPEVAKDQGPRSGPSTPTAYMPCGHLNWHSPTNNPVDCEYCKKGRYGEPHFMRGRWANCPVPKKLHRTKDSERNPGWPGYCTSRTTGRYIGGVSNDCRLLSNGKWRQKGFCEAHQPL